MGNITIFGAGITGLSTAAVLSQANPSHKITIVARDLPGDAPSQSWASPWYVGVPVPVLVLVS